MFLLRKKEFTTCGPCTSTGHCFVRLSPIVENSPLLPPVGVWADSSFCSSTYGVLVTVSSCCPFFNGKFLCVLHP
ncbi:hypothetical protein CY35_05G092500, partial [Sphagnum magellanicum]